MSRKLPVPDPKREADLAEAIGLWGFSGHDCSEDELIHAAFLMLQHALSMPELHKWQLAPGKNNMQTKRREIRLRGFSRPQNLPFG